MKQTTILTTFLLTSCLLLSGHTLAADNIGRVIYASGEIQAENNGQIRTLKRGSYIRQGDKITTKKASRSHLRMTDGALFALRPGTQMRFENYTFTRQSRTGNSLLSLVKGGFRTITGLIGKFNKKNYKVRTSVATIGIRGTHYGLTLCQQNDCSQNGGDFEDGLYGSVVDGEVVAENDAGEFSFANDEYFLINNLAEKPRALLRPPGIIFEQTRFLRNKQVRQKVESKLKQTAAMRNNIEQRQDYIRNQVEKAFYEAGQDGGNNTNLIETASGSTLQFSFLAGTQVAGLTQVTNKVVSDGTPSNQVILNVADNSVFVPVVVNQVDQQGVSRTLAIADAKPTDVGAITVANTRFGWGRWDTRFVSAVGGNPQDHSGALHYAFARNTTQPSELASLTASANYVSVAGTRPTDLSGNQAGKFAQVQIAANFGSGAISYDVATSIAGTAYTASGSDSINNAVTSGFNLNNTTNTSGTPTTGTGFATLDFVGSAAEAAISTFSIRHNTDTLPSGEAKHANGSVILTRGTLIPNGGL